MLINYVNIKIQILYVEFSYRYNSFIGYTKEKDLQKMKICKFIIAGATGFEPVLTVLETVLKWYET